MHVIYNIHAHFALVIDKAKKNKTLINFDKEQVFATLETPLYAAQSKKILPNS